VKYYESEETYIYKNINHYLPCYFHLFVGHDKIYPKFEVNIIIIKTKGAMSGWRMHLGSKAYILPGREMIEDYPYEPPAPKLIV
jgi:hypothetical protein